ncbi:hypothetical protein BJ508DRAFT_363378 [Ascobolus immersus RN42]|uniref:Uncharacterized protein n=1 Tax=Ascobolus immersus RN42 TaxID=1160509 RepID=A0A3N4I3F1_ASCIM|nr:hypothetical protein BJ508DRAFT_363378 [Ascobolus immersus RN42]
MQLSALITLLAALPAALAAPVSENTGSVLVARQSCPSNSGKGCGSYQVSGLGSRKRQILNSGGGTWELAIAMMETERMSTDYAYGDNKQNDAANFGIFKQNWGMLRVCCNKFKGQSQSSWNNGNVLNNDLTADIKCRQECQNYYGADKWWAGHRNGASGLNNPYTADINLYKSAASWTHSQIVNGHTTDDWRFWVDVVPI